MGGRIEDALAKLKAGSRAEHAPPSPLPARLIEATVPVQTAQHEYRGRHLELDFAALRAMGLCAFESQEHRLAEEYRVVKRPLLAAASAGREPAVPRGNLLMVGSAFAGEGKTFTCLNLCLSIARERDWSVVLIDADCHKRHLTRAFGIEREPGFMDLLRDPQLDFDSLIMPTDVRGFSVLPVGGADEHASELLASAWMDALCDWLARSDPQRLIVFDSAPILMTAEAAILASKVGQVVLVVMANKTPQQAVLAACDKLDPSRANSLLLNRVESARELASYGGYYMSAARNEDAPEER